MVPTGIDKEKIFLQLERFEENLARLKEIQKTIEKEKTKTLISAAERILQVSIEECLNIGSHLIAGLELKRADTYRGIFRRLTEAKMLSPETGKKLEEFASFRNRLVHLYWEVTEEEVISKLKELDILKSFAKEVLKKIEEENES